jgi:anti-sigma factor RsiW
MAIDMTEQEEIETLLPWFVTGKLSAEERQRVERYLDRHPDLERQIALAREESAETIADAEALGTPSRASFDRLMAQVSAAPAARANVTGGLAALLEQIADWLSGFSRMQLGAAAMAAALLIAVQAGALVYLGERGGGQTYQTASGPADAPAGQGTFALVSFKATASAGEVAALLAEQNFQIVDGPKAGMYRVRLSPSVLAAADAEAKLAALRAKDNIVAFVSLTP